MSKNEQSITNCLESNVEIPTFYNTEFRVSKSLNESKEWFNSQKKVLLTKQQLFHDPFCCPNDKFLCNGSGSKDKLQWKRPPELCKNPQFIIDGRSRFDVVQGFLGDCWLLAAIGSLSLHSNLMNQVIPEDQYFDRDYVGAFLFRLWRDGTWYDVVVDDRLPSENGKLIYMRSNNLDEFWSALLEKAFAKLRKSYDNLDGGYSWKAMETLTGGIIKIFNLGSQSSPKIWDIMVKASNMDAIMCCPINNTQFQLAQKLGLFIPIQTNQENILTHGAKKKSSNWFSCIPLILKSIKKNKKQEGGPKKTVKPSDYLFSTTNNKYLQTNNNKNSKESNVLEGNLEQREIKKDNGLIEGHAYSVTDVEEVDSLGGKINLVRIRNPWGNEVEWKGAYSDNSSDWNAISETERKRLELKFNKDGEFWMCFRDFITYFSSLEICYVTSDITLDTDKKQWKIYNQLGKWSQNNSLENAFHLNPQYRFTVLPNEKDPDKRCETIVCITLLEQSLVNMPDLSFIYSIFKIEEDKYMNSDLDPEFFKTYSSYLKNEFLTEGMICSRCLLPPGKYVIIPSTVDTGIEADFLLRILCEPELAMESSY